MRGGGGGGLWGSCKSCLLGKSEIWHSSLKKQNIQYCGETPWPKGNCWSSDRHGSNFEFCVIWFTYLHPEEVRLAQFSLHMQKGGPKPIHFILIPASNEWKIHTDRSTEQGIKCGCPQRISKALTHTKPQNQDVAIYQDQDDVTKTSG